MIVAIVGGLAAILIALVAFLTIGVQIMVSDRNADAILIQARRKHGRVIADPEHYVRLRALHTSRRVKDMRPSRFARIGL